MRVKEEQLHEGILPAIRNNVVRTHAALEEFLLPLKNLPAEHFVALRLNCKHEVTGYHRLVSH